MGRKGVSKRKPKKTGKNSTADNGGSSKGRSPVQNLMNDKAAPASRESMKPSAGSSKSQKKR